MMSSPIRSCFLFVTTLLVALQSATVTVQAVVLIPSSQYRMALRPTFHTMDMESVHALQKSMESLLMQVLAAATTEETSGSVVPPTGINVVIQSHKLGNTAASAAASTNISLSDLPTTLITFAVLGSFEGQQPVATGTTIMDNLLSKVFTRATHKAVFLASLKATQDSALKHAIDVSIEVLDKESQMSNPIVEKEEESNTTTKKEGLTVVDISLIAVSSLIFIGIAMVVIQSSRKEKTKRPPRSHRNGGNSKYPSPAVQQKLSVPSFDESMRSTPHLQFLPETTTTNSDSLPEQTLKSNEHFRILHHSPPKTLVGKESTMLVSEEEVDEEQGSLFEQHETGIMSMSSLPSSVASGDTPQPGAVSSSGDSSSSSGGSSFGSGGLPASLGSLSGHFPSSKWFEDGASQNSFSVDSQDIFGVDVESNNMGDGGDDYCMPSGSKSVSSKTIDSAHGSTSLVEWARTIRVINSDNNPSSVATPHSAPELEHYFNGSHGVDDDDDWDADSIGFATM